MREILVRKIKDGFDGLVINGSMKNRIPGNLNLTFKGLNNEPFIQKLKLISVSSGSACTSGTIERSHVLSAMKVDKNRIDGSFRISAGRNTTKEEIIELIKNLDN